LGVLLIHDPVSTKKNSEVEEDQRKRDDRPAPGRHILVLDRDEHGVLSVGETRENAQMPSGE